jgi:hypothetical protein
MAEALNRTRRMIRGFPVSRTRQSGLGLPLFYRFILSYPTSESKVVLALLLAKQRCPLNRSESFILTP